MILNTCVEFVTYSVALIVTDLATLFEHSSGLSADVFESGTSRMVIVKDWYSSFERVTLNVDLVVFDGPKFKASH